MPCCSSSAESLCCLLQGFPELLMDVQSLPFSSPSLVLLELKSAVEQRLGLKPVAGTPEPVELYAGEVGSGSLPDRTPTPTSTEVRHGRRIDGSVLPTSK